MDMENTYWNSNGKHQKEYEALWERLVPVEGKAVTKAGEPLRAVSRLYYRWYNDGDRIQPCMDEWMADSSAVQGFNYLYQFRDPVTKFSTKPLMETIVEAATEADYEEALEQAVDAIIEWAVNQPDTPNEDDFLDKKFDGAYEFEILRNEDEEEDW